METTLTQVNSLTPPIMNNRGWKHLVYALLALTAAFILSTSSCDDSEDEKITHKPLPNSRFSITVSTHNS